MVVSPNLRLSKFLVSLLVLVRNISPSLLFKIVSNSNYFDNKLMKNRKKKFAIRIFYLWSAVFSLLHMISQ